MDIRKSKVEDIPEILNILEEAKKYLKDNDVEQWQNGYPNEDIILEDIKKGESYISLEDNRIVGTFALSYRGEETYSKIFEGSWLSEGQYGVIHRIAVSGKSMGKGLASRILSEIENLCILKGFYSIKIDTHIDNKSMQGLLKKNQYDYCGLIYLSDGAPRIAFEKLLKEKGL